MVFTNGACAYDCSTAPARLWREKWGEEARWRPRLKHPQEPAD
jgi:hypothetical protein